MPRVMNKVKQFKRLSGLQVQPIKSKIILLNTAVDTKDLRGIPVLRHGATVRYLGYAVGAEELTTVNWGWGRECAMSNGDWRQRLGWPLMSRTGS